MAEVKDALAEQNGAAAQESAPDQTAGKVAYDAAAAAPEQKKRPPMSRKKRRKLIRMAIILVILAGGVFALMKFLGSKKSDTSTVVEDTVQYGSITSTVEGSGLTRAKNSQTITLSTAGTVMDVLVAEGDHVTAGQPLYTVDSPAAAAAVKKAQSDVDGYEKQIKTLQKDIAGLNLAAGYPGKLMEVATLNPGDTITKGQEVATLSDDTRLRLEQYYSYAYAGQIKTGQSVQVSVPALMTTLTGRIEAVHMVTRITPEGSKLFEADIVVTNPGTLTADMAASATVAAGGETAYPYEASKLKYYRTGKLTSTVDGTVISSDLVNYLQVKEGQVLVRISGEDSESQLFTLQQSLSDAQKSLDDAKKNQANCSAVAPIDGTVIGLALQSGAEVAANTAAITIADTTTIMIDATVDERNVSYVKAGTPVNITDWSGNTYSGMVETVSLTSKVENGVASYPMTISLDNSAGTIMVGSNVNYSLVASQNDNCLVLPLQAVKYVQLDDGTTGTVVFVKADSKPDGAIDLTTPVDGVPEGYWPVPVEIGISDNYNVEIKSGAEEGTTVFDSVQTTSSFG